MFRDVAFILNDFYDFFKLLNTYIVWSWNTPNLGRTPSIAQFDVQQMRWLYLLK